MNTNNDNIIRGVHRKWYWAGFLSYLAPGLGQIYNGQVTKGLLLYCLYSFWGSILFIISLNAMKHNFFDLSGVVLFLCLIVAFFIFLSIIIDAIRGARRQKDPYHLKVYNKWYIYVLAILVLQGVDYFVQSSIRDVLVKPYRIPTVSMEPTLQTGDFILNNKLSYCTQNPKRGDVVIFQYPPDEKLIYVKRIIGLPGDKLEIKDKDVFINGHRFNETYVDHIDSNILPAVAGPRDNFGPFVVPSNKYFVMGDNRDNSLDSRYWGTVGRSQIKGKPSLVYWSWAGKFPFIRFGRIGKKVA